MAKETSKYPITSFDVPWDNNEHDNLPQSGKQMREFLGAKHKELQEQIGDIVVLVKSKMNGFDLYDEEHGFKQSFVAQNLENSVFTYKGNVCEKWMRYSLSSEDAKDPKSPIRSQSSALVVKITSDSGDALTVYLFYMHTVNAQRKPIYRYITYLEEEDLPKWAVKRIGANAYTKEEIDNMCLSGVYPTLDGVQITSVGGTAIATIPAVGAKGVHAGVMTYADKYFLDNLRDGGGIYNKSEVDTKVSEALQSAKNFTDEEINGLRMDVTPSNTKVDIAVFNAASELIEEIELGLATNRLAGLFSPEYKNKIDELISTLEAYSEVWAASLVNLNKRVDEVEKRNPDTEIEDGGGGGIAPPPDEEAEEIAP